MDNQASEPITTPGVYFSVKAGTPVPKDAKVNLATATTLNRFEEVKHLLSGKALRRPNRNRPLE
jgi:hypothetical protein